MCAVLRQSGEAIPDISDLELRGEIVFVPLGGSTLALWASRLAVLNRPEFYLCDRDEPPPNPPKYNDFLNQVNSRENASCVVTEKREMENYIHHEAIVDAYAANGISGLTLGAFGPFEDVPLTVAHAVFQAGGGSDWGALSDETRSKKQSRAKKFLNREAVQRMFIERLSHSDPEGEVLGWFKTMQTMIADSP